MFSLPDMIDTMCPGHLLVVLGTVIPKGIPGNHQEIPTNNPVKRIPNVLIFGGNIP